MANKMDINLVPLQNVGAQKNWDNYEGSLEIYFRRSIFLPFLDHLSMWLKIRIFKHRELLSKIQKYGAHNVFWAEYRRNQWNGKYFCEIMAKWHLGIYWWFYCWDDYVAQVTMYFLCIKIYFVIYIKVY